jgi:hypothetical protein
LFFVLCSFPPPGAPRHCKTVALHENTANFLGSGIYFAAAVLGVVLQYTTFAANPFIRCAVLSHAFESVYLLIQVVGLFMTTRAQWFLRTILVINIVIITSSSHAKHSG